MPAGRPGGEAPGERAKPQRGERRARPVRRRPFLIGAFGDEEPAEQDRARRDRHVQQEDERPARPVDQPATEQRRNRAGDRPRRRPAADRAAARLAGEGGAQDGEAVRQQHRRAEPLQRPGAKEDVEARRRRAEQGGEGEEQDAAEQHLLAPVKIARRAAGQQQRRERQGEGVHHPLHLGGRRVEARPIAGRATFSTEPSMKARLEARMQVARTARGYFAWPPRAAQAGCAVAGAGKRKAQAGSPGAS